MKSRRWGSAMLIAFVTAIMLLLMLTVTNVQAREAWARRPTLQKQEVARARAGLVTDPYMFKLRRVQERVWSQPSPATRQILRAWNDGLISRRQASWSIYWQKRVYGR